MTKWPTHETDRWRSVGNGSLSLRLSFDTVVTLIVANRLHKICLTTLHCTFTYSGYHATNQLKATNSRDQSVSYRRYAVLQTLSSRGTSTVLCQPLMPNGQKNNLLLLPNVSYNESISILCDSSYKYSWFSAVISKRAKLYTVDAFLFRICAQNCTTGVWQPPVTSTQAVRTVPTKISLKMESNTLIKVLHHYQYCTLITASWSLLYLNHCIMVITVPKSLHQGHCCTLIIASWSLLYFNHCIMVIAVP